tara:strand:+ start:7143 stop:7424 length:282 start_codon:yes stop_codon:yes gene_type:complete
MRVRTYNTKKPVWTVEDLNEFVHYGTTSRKDLARYLERYKDKFNDGQYIVCYYKSIKNLVPESAVTVKTFKLQSKVKDKWTTTKDSIRTLIGK